MAPSISAAAAVPATPETLAEAIAAAPDVNNWLIVCKCGRRSVSVHGPKAEAAPQAARQSGFKLVGTLYYCRKCAPKAHRHLVLSS